MVLEKGVASTATRERLLNGPLAELIEDFYLWLKEKRFSAVIIGMSLLDVSFLQEYVRYMYVVGMMRLAPEDIEGFLRLRSTNGAKRSMRRFVV